MRTAAARPRLRSGGFTLLELLVVVLLIGIILSFASLSMGDGGRQERIGTEAQRLAALIDLGSDEAVLRGRDLGVQFFQGGYRFTFRSQGHWNLLEDDVFRPRLLPQDVGLGLLLERAPVELSNRLPADFKPQLLLLASGERTPFELRVMGLDGRPPLYQLRGDLIGRVALARGGSR